MTRIITANIRDAKSWRQVLRLLRQEQNLTRAEVSRKTDINDNRLRRLENGGVVELTPEEMFRLYEAYGARMELVGREP